MSQDRITVSILGKDIGLSCKPGEQDKVEQAAKYANQLMLRLQESLKYSDEKVALLACIQLAMRIQNLTAEDGPLAGQSYGQLQEKINEINALLDSANTV